MSFLERLRAYLERVERAPEGLPAVHIDLAAHRRHFAADCDRANEWRAARLKKQKTSRDLASKIDQEAWKDMAELAESLASFVEEVAAQILEGLAPSASPEELSRLVNAAISSQIGGDATTGSRGLDEEIMRLATAARSRVRRPHGRDGWEFPARYAFEIQATRRRNDRHVLTRGGAAFLELPGVDAVRWLLALEAAQSLGRRDEWRISSDLAAEILREPVRTIEIGELRDGSWQLSLATIRRLAAMKLLDYQDQDLKRGRDGWFYSVFERTRPLLEEVAEQRPTPFAVLANALLRDEVTHTLDSVRPDPDRALGESAAAATALQARMVVHEIRNALIPSQIALSRIARELGDVVQTESLARHQSRVKAGIERALAFADEMLKVANLGVEPAAPFDIAAAVRDAIAGVSAELNGSLRYTPPAEALRAVGHRDRFALAVTNLLRNAAQSVAGAEGLVEVTIEVNQGLIALRVDDNGSGVPPQQRRAIFESGVALRPGGSGQGLSLVRQVIEGEMRGSVTCADSPLGGARFEIIVPARETRDT